MFANDLAYHGENTTFEQYTENSRLLNILNIVWKMEISNDQQELVPAWPVVIVNRDIRFNNKEPMELGMHYSYRYWQAYRENLLLTPEEKDEAYVRGDEEAATEN